MKVGTVGRQPSHKPFGDPPAVKRAALLGEEGVAESIDIEERPTLGRSLRLQQFERIVSALQSLAIFLRFVARLARDGHEATRIVMAFAEIGPKLVPRGICLCDRRAIARRSAISATDDAMMVAGGAERIGDRPLLEKRDLVTALRQRPGTRQSGDAASDYNDFHSRLEICFKRAKLRGWRPCGKPR